MAGTSQDVDYPTRELIIELNRKTISEIGVEGEYFGSDNLQNENSLVWVLEIIQGPDYFPSISAKATALSWTINNNHVFWDGNKRTGMLVLMLFLQSNGFFLRASKEEIKSIAKKVAEGVDYTRDDYHEWVKKHLEVFI